MPNLVTALPWTLCGAHILGDSDRANAESKLINGHSQLTMCLYNDAKVVGWVDKQTLT